MVDLTFELEELHRKEPELFIKHVAEMCKHDKLRGRTLTAADKVAHSLTYITDLYAEAIKRNKGGWTCGTNTSNVRAVLSRTISYKYHEEQILRFIDFCCDYAEDQNSLQHADQDVKGMATYFLSIRHEPLVHAPGLRWKQMLDSE